MTHTGKTAKLYGEKLLRLALNHSQATFRAGQWEAIARLVEKRQRLLVVQRTGWGKSIVYFLTTRLVREQGAGPTVVISPLLALIRNQLAAAERLGLRAASINSDNTADWERIESDFLAGQVDVLLVSPERLANQRFRAQVLGPAVGQQGLGLFVVDEAHCISDWGHDFRPDYRRITRLLQTLPPNVPVLATTATANDRVVADINDQIGVGLHVIRGPLVRSSLRLQNISLPTKAERMAWLAHFVPKLPGSGIVYTLTVRDAIRVAGWLQSQGIAAEAYYGGRRDDISRAEMEQALLNNQLKVLVATTALGMGFDKPDLGFVIHFQRPGSVVHYYQQVGRAGRAIDKAYGILLSGEEDKEITDYFITSAFPPVKQVNAVLAALQQAEALRLRDLERMINISRGQLEKVLKLLSVEDPSPVGKEKSKWYRTPVPYQLDEARIARLTAIRRREQAEMDTYLHSTDCLMQFLQLALDDPAADRCGRCAPCRGHPIVSEQTDETDVRAATAYLGREYVKKEPRRQYPRESLPHYGWGGKIAPELQAEPGYALCLWGDPGLGALVRAGKQQSGRFSDQLVRATAEMIRHHWHPDPPPTWLTCIPSHRHPELVPDFARRLAQALNLPFRPCIRKIRDTEPQKMMQNSFQQLRNLDGIFTVTPPPELAEPVYLVDDIIDSRWTMTVVATLLRQAGSGPVYPVALADTSYGGG
jgi:ATP-dependent DNA helicase RecQ